MAKDKDKDAKEAKDAKMDGVSIQELISLVKRELVDRQAEEEGAILVIDEIELDVAFTVERKKGGEVVLKVVEADQKPKGEVQRVKIELEIEEEYAEA